MRVQRTCPSSSAPRSTLVRHPLDRAMGEWALNNPHELKSRRPGGDQRAKEEIEPSGAPPSERLSRR